EARSDSVGWPCGRFEQAPAAVVAVANRGDEDAEPRAGSVVASRCVGDHEDPVQTRVAMVVCGLRPRAGGDENLVAWEITDVVGDPGRGGPNHAAVEGAGRQHP